MARVLNYLMAVLGLWLAGSAGLLGTAPQITRIVAAASGVVLIVAAVVPLIRPSLGRPTRIVALVLGLWVFVAAALPFSGAGASLRWSGAVTGLLTALSALGALSLGQPASRFNLVDKNGGVLMEVTAVEFRGSALTMKGKMMGAMPTVAYLHPADAKQALRLIPASVIARLPLFLYRVFAGGRSGHSR